MQYYDTIELSTTSARLVYYEIIMAKKKKEKVEEVEAEVKEAPKSKKKPEKKAKAEKAPEKGEVAAEAPKKEAPKSSDPILAGHDLSAKQLKHLEGMSPLRKKVWLKRLAASKK